MPSTTFVHGRHISLRRRPRIHHRLPRFPRHFFALLCAAVLTASPLRSQSPPAWHQDLEPFVDGVVTTVMDQHAVAGAVVTIVTDDQVLLRKGYRLADGPTGTPVDPETDLFPVASVTKVFTAMSVLMLIDEGLLDLDQTIDAYLPDVVIDQGYGKITLGHLLGHSAGLEERHFGYLAERADRLGAPTAARMSALLPQQIRQPGEVIAYSNASYVLLGAIISNVSGRPYTQFVEQRILRPLGMEQSMFPTLDDPASDPPLVGAQVWADGRYLTDRRDPFSSLHAASGSLATTAEEMGHFLQMQLADGRWSGRQMWPAALIDRMRRPMFPGRSGFTARTFAYWTENWAGRTVYHHDGAAFGTHATILLVPEENIAIFVAANSPSGAALMGLPRRILREVINPDGRPPPAPAAEMRQPLSDYAGHFISTRRNETGFGKLWMMDAPVLTVTALDDGALLGSGLGYPRRFLPTGPDRFSTPEGDMHLSFRRDSGGAVGIADLGGGLHSFDRMRFWQGARSFFSGAAAAVVAVLLAALSARRLRTAAPGAARGMAALALLWAILIAVALAATVHLYGTPNLTRYPAPTALLWGLTAVVIVAALASIAGVMWVVQMWRTAGLGLGLRLTCTGAVAAQLWALIVLWQWNFLSLDPLW